MALNAASHNSTGEATGPVSGNPPQAAQETLKDLLSAQKSDPLGQHAGGHDGGDKKAEKKEKSEKELKKEREKEEKLRRFNEKKAKQQTAATANAGSAKVKEKKTKEEALPEYVEKTPPGQKKVLEPLDGPYHKAYNPKVVESAWYDWWEKEGFFKPEWGPDGKVKPEGHFTVVVPPPNVTGALHMGHAVTSALQDCMIRYNRMKGKTVLWLPGCDHAGIATQSVIENLLWRREQKTRHDIGREAFTERAWKWKADTHAKINRVQKRLGGSFDWTREAFTMDPNLSAAVTETFVQLHDEGIIYRANRLINWCTKLNTAISNLEVVNKELDGRTLLDVPGYEKKVEFGVLTYFKYPIIESSESIEVATTRPETMLGDTAIAVHPNDKRYQHLVGKYAQHPFVDRKLIIIADEYVDPDFGTGAVKLTPAHDPNDFELGKRHKLDFVNILTDDGFMNENTGNFRGSKRFDARYHVISALKEKNLYVKQENNPMKVPICDRSKDVIEPLIKPQWWMKMKDLAESARKVVESGEIQILPEASERSYKRWMSDVNDWCLSRQLWWGHQAPVYLIKIEGENVDEADDRWWVAGRTEAEAEKKARARYPDKNIRLERCGEVLDTWFSSGLWPFSTLGWPNKTHDFESLYPTSVLETGWDILFFWVARMVMLGLKMTGKVPFKQVVTHPLIRDAQGRKMSKSLGNVIDPVDVMEGIPLDTLHEKLRTGNLDPKEVKNAEKYQKTAFPDGIPECGADALRFALLSYFGVSDINFDIKVIHGYRRFCNKIYQATRYVLGNLPEDYRPPPTSSKTGKESLPERWILHKLTIASQKINEAIETRQFSDATTTAHQYFLTQLCDVYIENSKAIISTGTLEEQTSARNTLYTALESGLTMMHPMMPFITEELWQRLPRRPGDKNPTICKAAYPQYEKSFDDKDSEMTYDLILDISRGIRSLTGEYNIKEKGVLYVQIGDDTSLETANAEQAAIRSLSGKGVESISLLSARDAKPTGCIPFSVSSAVTVFLLVKGRVDIDQEIEKSKKKLAKANDNVKKSRDVLHDKGFQENATEDLKKVEEKKLADAEAELRELEASIEQFEQLKLE